MSDEHVLGTVGHRSVGIADDRDLKPEDEPDRDSNVWGIHCPAEGCSVATPCVLCAEQIAAENGWEGEDQERADLGPFYPFNTDQA